MRSTRTFSGCLTAGLMLALTAAAAAEPIDAWTAGPLYASPTPDLRRRLLLGPVQLTWLRPRKSMRPVFAPPELRGPLLVRSTYAAPKSLNPAPPAPRIDLAGPPPPTVTLHTSTDVVPFETLAVHLPLLRPALEATRPVAGAPNTLGAERIGPGEHSPTDQPLQLADDRGDLIIAPPLEADVRYVLLKGGQVKGQALTVRQPGTKLELDNVLLTVQGAATVKQNAEVVTHIRRRSAGLDLTGQTELDLTGGRLIVLFHDHPEGTGLHWGLRAAGDRRDSLRDQIEAGELIVAAVRNGGAVDAEPLLIFDGQFTYLTIDKPVYDDPICSFGYVKTPVPEPGLVGLLATGGLALLRRRRRSDPTGPSRRTHG